MSECPERLRDALTTGTVPRVRSVARCLSVNRDSEGRVAWSAPQHGPLTLPSVGEAAAGLQEGAEVVPHTTPAGFSYQYETTTATISEPIPGDFVRYTPADVLNMWETGDVAIEEASRRVFVDDEIGGIEEVYGVRVFPLRTPTLPPATHTNCYLLGHKDALIVDPGSPYDDELARFCEAYSKWQGQHGPAQAIFLTHHHGDHVGGAEALRDRLKLPIWAHSLTAGRVSFSVDRVVEGGDVIGPWEAVFTPGHAPGHLCLWDEARHLLICGDMVAALGTIVVEPRDGDMGAYLDSLRRLKALGPKVMFPAHGEPIYEPVARLDGYLAHRLWRETRIVAALAEGRAPLDTITARAYADVPSAMHWLAQHQALAHLQKLEKDGAAQQSSGKWAS